MYKTLTMHELADEAFALDELIAMDDGEWTDEHEALANELTEKLVRKTDSFGAYYTDLTKRAEILRDEEKRLAERRRRLERDIERLESYAMLAMDRMNTSKITGTLHTLAVRKNPPSVKVDESILLNDQRAALTFTTEVTVTKIDKALIRESLRLGDTVPGCELVQSQRLEVK